MNEEIMTTTNEEIMENEVTELTEVYDEVPAEISEGSGNGVVGKLVLVALTAAAAAVVVKKRDKIRNFINDRRARKLEKQGFKVEYPDEFFEEDFDEDFEVDCEDDGDGNIIEISEEK